MADEKMDVSPVHAVDELLKDGFATGRTAQGATWRRTRSQAIG